jgi:hypothetical protein
MRGRRWIIAIQIAIVAGSVLVKASAAPEVSPSDVERRDCQVPASCVVELSGGVRTRQACMVRQTFGTTDGGIVTAINVVAPAGTDPPWPIRTALRAFPTAVVGAAQVETDAGKWEAYKGKGGPPSWEAWPDKGSWSFTRDTVCSSGEWHGSIDAVLVADPSPSASARAPVVLRASF